MKPFQIILLAVFGFFILLAVLFFSGAIKIGGTGQTTVQQLTGKSIVVWGTFPSASVTDAVNDFAQANQMTLTYVEKDLQGIDYEIGEAIASQRGPDIVLAPYEVLLKHQSKFVHIPYDKFTDRAFRDLFVDQSRLFLLPDGILGFPMLLDPLIFYFNRVSYNNAGILNPPLTWEEVATNSLKLTRKSGTENILESGLPMGTFNNITHAKEIISLLLLQAGNPVVTISNDTNNKGVFSTLLQNVPGQDVSIAEYVIQFFTQFSDPLKNSYAWNRVLPEALDAFASEQAAQYIGFASEIPRIAETNPSLNFDVALIPQAEGVKANRTYSKMYGISVVKASREQFAAFQVALLMKDKDFSEKLLNNIMATIPIAPARKDILQNPPITGSDTQYVPIIYRSAVISAGWFDVNYQETKDIFESMVTQVLRNSLDVRQAVEEAEGRINNLLN